MYWLEVTALCGWRTAHDRVLCLTSVVLSVSMFVVYHFCVLFTLYVYATCLEAHLNTLVTYHKNHQRTRQLSASFAYYTLIPRMSITLLTSGRYNFVYLFTYLFTWHCEIQKSNKGPTILQWDITQRYSAPIQKVRHLIIGVLLAVYRPTPCYASCGEKKT